MFNKANKVVKMINLLKCKMAVNITSKILFLFFILINASLIFGQQTGIKVMAANGKIAAINAGSNQGIIAGKKYVLKRDTIYGTIEVGVIRIVKVLPDKSGVRLIENRDSDYIERGDYLGNKIEDSLEDLFGNVNEQDRYTDRGTSSDRKNYNKDSNKAIYDAEMAAEIDANKTMWFAMGCLLGPIGWLISEAGTPAPNASNLVGKSPEYVALYTDTYRSKVKKMRSGAAMNGCLVGTGIYVIFYALVIAAAESGY